MQYIPISFSAQIFWGKGQGRLHAPLLMPMQKNNMGTQAIGLLKIPINYFICVNDV